MKREYLKKIISSLINEEYDTEKNYKEAVSIINLIKNDLDVAIKKNNKGEMFNLVLGLRRLKRMIHYKG